MGIIKGIMPGNLTVNLLESPFITLGSYVRTWAHAIYQVVSYDSGHRDSCLTGIVRVKAIEAHSLYGLRITQGIS